MRGYGVTQEDAVCKIRWSPKVTTSSIHEKLEPNIRWVAHTLGVPHSDAARVRAVPVGFYEGLPPWRRK